MQNMILPKCAWANIQKTVGYTKHTHTHTHTYTLGPFQGWRETKWMVGVVCKQREKNLKKKSRKMIFQWNKV